MQHLLRLWWSHDANSVVLAQARTVRARLLRYTDRTAPHTLNTSVSLASHSTGTEDPVTSLSLPSILMSEKRGWMDGSSSVRRFSAPIEFLVFRLGWETK